MKSLIGSIISLISGVVCLGIGLMQNNDMELRFRSIYHSGNDNPGTIFIIIGIALLVLGFVLLFVYLSNKNNGTSSNPKEVKEKKPVNKKTINIGIAVVLVILIVVLFCVLNEYAGTFLGQVAQTLAIILTICLAIVVFKIFINKK